MYLLQCLRSEFSLSDASDIAQIILAVASLALAFYIFIYQRNKDNRTEFQTAQLNDQNIKLQWFKELIIHPNLPGIQSFYDHLYTIKDKIDSNDLIEEKKIEINTFIKKELSDLRKTFVDLLQATDPAFAKMTKDNLDNLVDGITEAIFNDELKLNNSTTYEKFIGSKITYSRNLLFSSIYNHRVG